MDRQGSDSDSSDDPDVASGREHMSRELERCGPLLELLLQRFAGGKKRRDRDAGEGTSSGSSRGSGSASKTRKQVQSRIP